MSTDYPTNSDDIIDVRSVISRVEELREQRTPRISVGFNMPGYMPDSEPSDYESWEDARSALVDILEEHADEDDSEVEHAADASEAEKLNTRIAELREQANILKESTKDEDYGRTIGKYHYWITDTGETMGLDEDEKEELKGLEELLGQMAGYGGNHKWEGEWYPVTLVRESYFQTFAQEEAESLDLIKDNASWPYTCIDWERAARELKQDYSYVDFGGESYYYRG